MSKNEESIKILRKVVVDGLLLSGLIICIYAISYVWDPFQRGFFCGDETLMYPYRSDTITVTMLRIMQVAPVLAILICEYAVLKSDCDDRYCLGVRLPKWLCGVYCTGISYGFGVCFVELTTAVAKHTIGRLRPHFFDVCVPSVDCSAPEWRGRYVAVDEYTCTGDSSNGGKFIDMHLSFLSGHSAVSAYSMIYIALYLEHRMRWRGSRLLRHTLQFLAVMLSWFTALSRVSDYKHHWSDVLAGYCMGVTFAILVLMWGTDLLKRRKNEMTPHDITLVSHQQIAISS